MVPALALDPRPVPSCRLIFRYHCLYDPLWVGACQPRGARRESVPTTAAAPGSAWIARGWPQQYEETPVQNEYISAECDDRSLIVSLKGDWVLGNVPDLEAALADVYDVGAI